MIPAKKLPRAIAFSPRFVDPLSGSIFIVIKGETQPALPSPPLQYKHLPRQQSKNPCFLQVAGTLWQVCTYTSSFAESIGRPSFFAPWRCFWPAKFYLNGGPIRPQPRLPQSTLAIGPDSGDREEGTAE